jgi:hypothetical protein
MLCDIAQSRNSMLCGIARSCDSALCGIAWSRDSALCGIVRSFLAWHGVETKFFLPLQKLLKKESIKKTAIGDLAFLKVVKVCHYLTKKN